MSPQEVGELTVGASPSHFMELLPGKRTLNVLDVFPGPPCSLFLDGILQEGLQRQQHADHILGRQSAHLHHCEKRQDTQKFTHCERRL